MRRRDANSSQSQRRKKSQKTKKKLLSPIDINPRKPYILIINKGENSPLLSPRKPYILIINNGEIQWHLSNSAPTQTFPAHVANYIMHHADVSCPEQLSIEFINEWFSDKNWEGEGFDNPANYRY
jgi:hypothetical protein